MLLLSAYALLDLTSSHASAANLAPLLDAPGSTVTLNGGTVYTISEYVLSVSKTLLCNGATIQSTGGPIRASGAGVTFVVDQCVIQGTGWALLGALSGASLIVRNNTQLTGNGANSAVYVSTSTLDMTGGTANQFMWGVNMQNSNASLHGVSITNTIYGVQNVAGTVTLDNHCQLQNLNASNPGAGVSLIASASYPSRGASAVIRDSAFTGFGNAVDIQPTAAQGLPAGTADISGSTFDVPFYSALAAVDANNVHFATSRVTGAKTDGLYLANSTGVIENSEILNSQNSGVTFWGCPNGATLQKSLVSGSIDQGVAVVADGTDNRVSHHVLVLDNTLKGNAIANVYVDNLSDALVQGNTLTGASNMSARIHGASGVDMIGNLFVGSQAGLEMKDGSFGSGVLSIFTGHNSYGALVYANAAASFSHSAFESNGLLTGDYSIFVNTGAQVTLQRSILGPPAVPAFYNNAADAVTVTNNYWGDATGPRLLGGGGGNGSTLGWDGSNGSTVSYQPFLTTAPLNAVVNQTFSLTAGTITQWQPSIGLTLSLTGAPGITGVSGGLAAGLRLTDTSTFTAPYPPAGTFSDGIIAVWAEYDLLSRAQSGSLRFLTAGSGQTATLSRLEPDRCWLPVTTTWDAGVGEIVYSPTDLKTLNGVFALGATQPDQQTVAQQLITSYYWNILGRAPEAGAVSSWYQGYFQYAVSNGIDVQFVPREMARIFFASAEYQGRGRTDQQFIDDCYQVFLGRAPSAAELNAWLQGTWNRSQVVTLFAESAEFGGYIQGLFPCLAGTPTRNFVTTMYSGLLDRLVDASGLSYWQGVFDAAFASGGIESVRAQARSLGVQVLASTEYQSHNPTHETDVEHLYRAYLGRFPATSESDYWRGQLDAHLMTTTDLINQFAAAPEFTARLDSFFGPE